jgi:dTDP-4-amino-4,6-dideoxygalactose transaminase
MNGIGLQPHDRSFSLHTAVPFFRPDLGNAEIEEVVSTMRSGWLTTGPRVKQFEQAFSAAVGAPHGIAVNSCTAALHLAMRALSLPAGMGVLVPAMTFAATAEVIQYEGGIPVLVDSDRETLNMNLVDAAYKLAELRAGRGVAGLPADLEVVGMIPVHVGGFMMNVEEVKSFASRHGLWVVEDAAHAFPASWRRSPAEQWQHCGQGTAAMSCFSFYANKTITTGEGGLLTTDDAELAMRVRQLSLHGLSQDAWGRYSEDGSWDYRIMMAGYKYNMPDLAAAIGLHQLRRAEEMRRTREAIAGRYLQELCDVDEIELPITDSNRIHAWHLFPVRIRAEALRIDRNEFIRELNRRGISCSVHWRPLHLHPHYENVFGWCPADLPVASAEWSRLVSLPLFSAMHSTEVASVVEGVRNVCQAFSRARYAATQ